MGKYVNLHQHSENSTLDGYAKVDEIVKYAKLIGSPAAALTDHGECSGHLQLMKASKEHDLPVVYGQEGYWVWDIDAFRLATKPGSDPVYPGSVIGEKATNSHICLLAETNEGLSNLWAWSSMAYEPKNHHHKPLADPAMMREYAKGLWASDGCMLTEFGHAVEMGDHARAREIFAFLLNIFGDRFYSELHTWRILEPGDDEKAVRMNELMRNINQAKISLANEMGVPLVVVNDAHYTQEDDWEYHRLVWKFNTHGDTDQTDSHKHAADWLMNDAEIYHHMAAHGVSADVVSQAIDNSYNIAMSCQQVEITPTMTMPRLTATDHDDMNMFMDAVQQGYMRKVVDAGLDENLYFPRMESECRLIVNKGFSGYFNITRDMVLSFRDGSYIQWVKGGADKDPRLTGPGRGSAGGSLVSYLLDITSLDPIKYGLLFERFLTEDREDWPDIDTDVPQSARPDAKSFIHARHDHTCAIGTRSRSKAAQTLKDLREPLNIDWGDITEIGKLLKTLENVVETTGDEEMDAAAVDNLTWGEIVELKGGELITWQKKHPKLFDYMERMVGLTRQTSEHAAGVLIGNNSFLGRIPTRIKNDTRTTQFDMHEVEALGAVKMDVLGIRHLDTLEQCRELVYERHGIWLDYDSSGFGQPPEATRVVRFGDEQYNDPKIWEPIARGETLGLFQLETSNGTQAAIDFRPRSEREVCDLISVNRPGVINAGQLPHYMARREGSEAVTYDHPLMEAVTGPGWASDTYGILVYQEQLMRAAEVLAGFTPAERERLRKIIGKKKMDQMIAMEGDFIARCLANPEFMKPYLGGKSPQDRARTTAEKIWRSLLASGAYAFNRCVSGDTLVKLGGAGSHSNGYMAIEDMWSRLHDLADLGQYQVGDPCRHCGAPSVAGSRQQCRACYSWRRKFVSNHRSHGVRSWSLGDDGRLHPNRIVDVHRNGLRPVWKVTLDDGKAIMATANHRHMTPDGWREVSDLSVGDKLLVCGEYEGQVYEASKDRTTMLNPLYAGARLPNYRRNGENSLGYRDGGFLALKEWTNTQEWECSRIDCTRSRANGDRIERAHLDGDRTNNDPSNLAMLCASHHKTYDYRQNGRRVRGAKGYPAPSSLIVAIEYVGEQMTYDLEMADPYHSWVGNDIVTHNSHGMGYGLVTTWEVWDRYYFFPEFITALLRTDPKKTTRYIRTARRRGIEVLPPDVNHSQAKFTLVGDDIRYGLQAIAKVGPAAVADITAGQPYSSFPDFLARSKADKAVVINLILIGALDEFGPRPALLRYYERHRIMAGKKGASVVVGGKRVSKDKLTEAEIDVIVQEALNTPKMNRQKEVVGPSPWIIEVPDFADEKVIMKIEAELVGNYVTIDPMYKYIEMIEAHCVARTADVMAKEKGATFAIGGTCTKVYEHTIKTGKNKGNKMAFLGVTWNDEEFDITVFSESWQQWKSYLHLGAPMVVNCIRDAKGAHMSSVIRLDWALGEVMEAQGA